MSESSGAKYDFAIITHADIDQAMLVRVLAELREWEENPKLWPSAEFLGRSETGDVVVSFRFPFAAYSSALRAHLEKDAKRLKGKLLDPNLLGAADRERLSAKMASYPVRVDASGDPAAAARSFWAAMGLASGHQALVFQLRFDSEDGVAAAFARCVAEGAIFIPTRRMPEADTAVELLFNFPGREPLEAKGHVLELRPNADPPGFRAALTPGEELREFVARRALTAREGKVKRPDGLRREHSRFETCLDVRLEDWAAVSHEYATNISKGGMFIRTTSPPALRSKVRVRVSLPSGAEAETEAEVVHVVTAEEGRARGIPPGAGVCFPAQAAAFTERITEYLARFQEERRFKVLVVDDDAFFRQVLSDTLGKAEVDVEMAASGEEAMEKLTAMLFELDGMVIDLGLPGIDGRTLIERIRRFGGEMDLKIIVVSGAPEDELAALKGPLGADETIGKGTPVDDIVRRIRRVLDL